MLADSGLRDTIKAMTGVYAALEQQGDAAKDTRRILSDQRISGSFRYDSQSNLLIFQPHQR